MSNSNFNHVYVNLAGRVFGRLTVIRDLPKVKGKGRRAECVCICGTVKSIAKGHLTGGKITSCGCAQTEAARKVRQRHNMSRTAEYAAWRAMWTRTTNPASASFPRYQSRRPPEIWRDFEVFYAELGARPGPGYSLDRVDNEKPYGPGNCRWATRREQNCNTGRNIRVDVFGKSVVLKEACAILQADYKLVYSTIRVKGIPAQTVVQALIEAHQPTHFESNLGVQNGNENIVD